MSEKLITVFTPTYNRAHILHRCYECLQNQSVYNFDWLIVDDGSSDNTSEIVQAWVKDEKRFDIKYVKKANGGLHTAYNRALEEPCHELFVCLESDDVFTEHAMEIIENTWAEMKPKGYAGYITLCRDTNGNIIGERFPDGLESTYYWKHRRIAAGDKQYIYRTDLLKRVFPMKVYKGEKFFDPKYKFFEIDQYAPLGVTNEAFDIVDYQEGGLTDTVMYHYYNSPNSFIDYRITYMNLPEPTFKYLFRQNIHYVAESCLAHKLGSSIKNSPKKGYTILAIVPGILFSFVIRYKNRNR